MKQWHRQSATAADQRFSACVRRPAARKRGRAWRLPHAKPRTFFAVRAEMLAPVLCADHRHEGNSGRGVACIRAPLRATACTVRSVQDVVSWRLPRTEQRIGYKYCTHAARRRALVSTFPSLVPTCTTPSQRCARSLSRYQPDCEIFSPRVSVMPPSTLLTRTIG